MPELPEVENFRRLLLPLVSADHPLVLERCSLEKAPPRKFISDEEISEIQSRKLVVDDVLRKGKLICMVLKDKGRPKGERKKDDDCDAKYLFLHMGMTGRVSTPHCIPKLKELSDTEIYPPPHTYLRLSAGPNQACFSDPRKFGAIYLKDVLNEDFDVLAPDAWRSTCTRQIKIEMTGLGDGDQPVKADRSTIVSILAKFTEQSMGIKGILLDQKRAISGVGNWVADEVLYQTKMHPDQNYLTEDEAKVLLEQLHIILDKAVNCLRKDQEFPSDWLFHYRWSKRGSGKTTVKDAHGRSIVFVTSGGRTSAVVPSIQKKSSRKRVTATPPKEQKKVKGSVKKRRRAMPTPKPSEAVSEGNVKKVKVIKKEQRQSTNCSCEKLERQKCAPAKGGTRRSPRLAKL